MDPTSALPRARSSGASNAAGIGGDPLRVREAPPTTQGAGFASVNSHSSKSGLSSNPETVSDNWMN